MKQQEIYVPVKVSERLPLPLMWVFTDLGSDQWNEILEAWVSERLGIGSPKWWLEKQTRYVLTEEEMEHFATWVDGNFYKSLRGVWVKKSQSYTFEQLIALYKHKFNKTNTKDEPKA